MQTKIGLMREFLRKNPTSTIGEARKALGLNLASSTVHMLKKEFSTKKPPTEKPIQKVIINNSPPKTNELHFLNSLQSFIDSWRVILEQQK